MLSLRYSRTYLKIFDTPDFWFPRRRLSVAQVTLGETPTDKKNTWPKHKLTAWKVMIRCRVSWFQIVSSFFPTPSRRRCITLHLSTGFSLSIFKLGSIVKLGKLMRCLERFLHVVAALPLPKLRRHWSHRHNIKKFILPSDAAQHNRFFTN